MSAAVYKTGGYLATDCPRCGQEVRVGRQGKGFRFICRGGCSDSDVAAALDPTVMLELGKGRKADRSVPPSNDATVQHPLQRCEGLARETRILERFGRDLKRTGLVGEDRCAKLLYLACTSRLFDWPVSIAVKGPSSGGKSFTVARTLDFFPHEAYHSLTSASPHALAYSDEPLVHRMLVVAEVAGSTADPDGNQDYLIRTLLSEGHIRHETVEKTKDGMKARLVVREGPTGLIVTTTKVSLHDENETRLISVTVKDTPEQTRAVMVAKALGSADHGVDMSEWEYLQHWLWQEGRREVVIPFGLWLAENIPPVATRLRRDFGALLTLIQAHALLHQLNREVDDKGRVVASVEDYTVVRELVADLFDEGVEKGASTEVRETVAQVEAMNADRLEGEQGISGSALADALELDKSTVSRRVGVAIRRGYVRNLEERRGRPARYVIGDAMPSAQHLLPLPERIPEGGLHGCTVVGGSTPTPQESTPPTPALDKTDDGCEGCGGHLSYLDEDDVRTCAGCGRTSHNLEVAA